MSMQYYNPASADPEPSTIETTLATTGWLLSRGLFAALFVLMFAPIGS